MAEWVSKKLNNANYIIKLVLVAVVGGLVLRWATNESITINQFTEAIASTPIYLIIAIEILDKLSDRVDYEFLGFAYGSKYGIGRILMSLIIAAVGFIAVVYFMTGTIALSTGAYNAGTLIAAALYALYIIAPETGDDELILFLWLAAHIATGGAYLSHVFALPFNNLNLNG